MSDDSDGRRPVFSEFFRREAGEAVLDFPGVTFEAGDASASEIGTASIVVIWKPGDSGLRTRIRIIPIVPHHSGQRP